MGIYKESAGSAGLGAVVGVALLIVLFLFSGGFFRSSQETLRASLEQKKFEGRYPALARAASLGPVQRRELAVALAPALFDPSAQTRLQAGLALGRLGTEARVALSNLIIAARSADTGTRRGAVVGLEAAAGLKVPYAVRGTLSTEGLEWRARKALLAIGNEEAASAAATYRGACPAAFRSGSLNWCD